MKASPKITAKAKPATPKVPAKAAAPAKKAPAKAAPAPAKKPVPAAKGATKAVPAPAAKKKPEPPAKKPAAPAAAVKGKKEEPKAAKAAAPAKAAPAVKAAVPVKVKAVKPPPAEKPPKVPKAPKKLPPAKGPMEKAQRSLAATAARAAAKDKVPPSKALAAVQEAKSKASGKTGIGLNKALPPQEVKVATTTSTSKKPGKAFFHEVAPGAERIIKRGDKTTATPIPADIQNRRRGGGGEESPEELVERIERELENQHIFKRNMLRPQLCTKCGVNQVSERFTIDKELGYCDDCAEILHLGETKEARKIDFHPTLMKKEGEPGAEGAEEEDEEEGPAAGPAPEID